MDDVTRTRLPAQPPRSGPVAVPHTPVPHAGPHHPGLHHPSPHHPGPHHPGPEGYLLAWWVSCNLVGTGLALPAAGDLAAATPWQAVATTAEWSALITVLAGFHSFPFAVAGVTVVHLACRRVHRQSVHVAAAGAAGAITGAALALLTAGEWPGLSLVGVWAGVAGAATATGRAAVVPLVLLRRDRARQPTHTAECAADLRNSSSSS